MSLCIVKAIPPNCPEKAVTEGIFFGNHTPASLPCRNSPEDNSQRMLNAIEPGTVMPIHSHLGNITNLAIFFITAKNVVYLHPK